MVTVIAMEVLPEERDRKYYADNYSCYPPPLFIILITLVEVSSNAQHKYNIHTAPIHERAVSPELRTCRILTSLHVNTDDRIVCGQQRASIDAIVVLSNKKQYCLHTNRQTAQHQNNIDMSE